MQCDKISKAKSQEVGGLFEFEFVTFQGKRYIKWEVVLFCWLYYFTSSSEYDCLIEEPYLTPSQAITKSRQIMDGYKWKLFCLYLSFAGWVILSIMTVGIRFLWLTPYYQASIAHFYNHIKDNPEGQGTN